MRKFMIVIFIGILFLTGCKQPERPVTKEESETLGKLIGSSIKKKDSKTFNGLFSPKLLADQIAKLRGKSASAALVKGVTSALNSATLGQQIIGSMGKDGSYEMVKIYEKDKVQHVIYRLYADGKLNYHDFELRRYKNKPYISDMFVYVSGENFSKTVSDLEEAMRENDMTGRNEARAMSQIRELIAAGKYEAAEKAYEKLPGPLKIQRSIQLVHVLIAGGISEEKYKKAIDDFKKLYPDEPQMYMLMIDASIMEKDYAGALDYVNKVDAMINKDPFLDYYRGLISKLNGDTAIATTHFESLYKNMPHFSGGVLELINQYLEAGNFEKAKELISYYKKQKDFDQLTLTFVVSQYPGFTE